MNGPTTVRLGAAVVVLAAATGCGDPLKAPALIEEPRVIGGRVEVDGAPAAARPGPGEGATVRFLVGYPGAPVPMTVGLVVCPGLPSSQGVPGCAGAPYAVSVTREPSSAPPSLHFLLPDADAITGVDRALALGLLCPAGEPELGESITTSGCSVAGVHPLRFSLDIGIDRGDGANQNPNLEAAALELDAEPWPAALPGDFAAAPCTGGDSLPAVTAGSGEHSLALTVSPSDREPLVSDNPLDPTRESLQLSYLTTAGELDHPYAFLEASAASDRLEVAWKAPGRVDEGGEIVRFYFVGRDPRGGLGWAERAVCVHP